MNTDVELKMSLMEGGMFYASWPKTITGKSLRMVTKLFGLTMEAWIDAAARRDAADIEYESWLHKEAL